MADGYIEKRYAEVFGANGKATAETPRRPSLDSLLVKCKPAANFIEGYPVHPSQMEAILASAEKVTSPFVCEAEGDRIIILAGDAVRTPALFTSLGILLQTICLKITELGLGYSWSLRQDEDPVATITVGKP